MVSCMLVRLTLIGYGFYDFNVFCILIRFLLYNSPTAICSLPFHVSFLGIRKLKTCYSMFFSTSHSMGKNDFVRGSLRMMFLTWSESIDGRYVREINPINTINFNFKTCWCSVPRYSTIWIFYDAMVFSIVVGFYARLVAKLGRLIE